MSDMDINAVVQQMRAISATINGDSQKTTAQADTPEFSALLKASVDKVNQVQSQASHLTRAFESGDPQVNLTEVMVAIQKASVSFQAMSQVRNHLVSAYKEIMNMQV